MVAVHCTGRMWGLWATKTYFMQMHEIIRNVTGVRPIVQPFAADQAQKMAPKTEAATDHPSTNKRSGWLLTFTLVALPALLFALYQCLELLSGLPVFVNWVNSFSFFSSNSKQDGSTPSTPGPDSTGSYWTFKNCTECCDNDGTGMDQSTAMTSYNVDLHYPRWDTNNPVLLALFDTAFSPVTEFIYVVWIGFVSAVVLSPYIMLAFAEAAGVLGLCCYGLIFLLRSVHQHIRLSIYINRSPANGYRRLEIHDNRQTIPGNMLFANWKPREIRKDNQPSGRSDLEGYKQETIAHHKSTNKTKKIPFCVCAQWVQVECIILVAFSRVMFWLFLPLPVLGLIIPEQFQLPSLLLLLSVVAVGIVYWLWKGICIGWRKLHADCGDHIRRMKVASGADDAPLLTPC